MGTVLLVSGADMMDGTPIYDIKPYLPHIDSIPDAEAGFAGETRGQKLSVAIPDELLTRIPKDLRETVRGILAEDPRPGYHDDPDRVYGFSFSG